MLDASFLQSSVDQTKFAKVADVRGTELDKGQLDELPDEANIYLGDILSDFRGMNIYANSEATFDAVFANRYIYCLEATFELLDAEKYLAECKGFFREDEAAGCTNGLSEAEYDKFSQSMLDFNRNSVAVCRNQLHQLVQANLLPGEMVEIYTEFISGSNFHFGPAKETRRLTQRQILSSDLLQTEDKVKIEIFCE